MPRKPKGKLHAAKIPCQVQGETPVLQETQATPVKKKTVSFPASPPVGVTTHTDSASQSQRPPEGSQRAFSTTTATNVSSARAHDRATCKSKKKKSLTQAANTLVNYIVDMYKKKRPIKKKDMLKLISEKHKKRFPQLLRRAAFNIEVVFGMDLKEVNATKRSYTLVSKMNLPYNGMLSCGRGFPKTGILMNLLGVIFMKGNSATEEKVWEFLNKMRMYDGKRHFLFGEPRKLITQDLVKLEYLEYRQVPGSDPPQYEFLWGPRAYAETSKMKILEFWAKINHTVPSAFESRYEEALREEKEPIEAKDHTNAPARECSIPGVASLPTILEVDQEDSSHCI